VTHTGSAGTDAANIETAAQEPTHEHKGVWTPDMKTALRQCYAQAREERTLATLATTLGVDLYQLYGQAHRMGLSRGIRRR
jgi:hypothetical protein